MSSSAVNFLPESLGPIVEAIGFAATLRLVERFGGVPVYIPQAIPPDHHLVVLLGRKEAGALADLYGGEDIAIPKCLRYLVDQRNQEIREKYTEGVSAPRLARDYDLTERWVRRIVSGWSSLIDERQGKLF